MPIHLTTEWAREWEARSKRKPLTDINNGGPASSPNPINSTAPSRDHPMRGSDNAERKARGEDVDSMDDDSAKPDLDDMAWMLGGDLDYERDPQTGLAKWPLSFKRIKRDVDKGKKGYEPTPASPQSVEMAPRAV